MTKKIKTESLDRDEMFTLLPPHVLAVSERALTDNQKMFLALLKKQATMNGTNESLMSASDSASELCGFCKRTLYNSVRPRLVELGLITPRIGEHGGKKINYYTLNTDRLNDRDFFNELNKEYDMAKKTPKKENKNELRRLKKEIEELKNEVTQLKNYLYTCIPKNSNGYTAENVDKQEVHDLYTCIPDNVPKYTPKYTAENADNQQVFLYTQNQKNDKGYTYDMICNEINTLLQNLLVTGTSREKIPERKLTYSHAHARVDEHVGDEILDLEDGNPDGQANSPQPGSEISAEKNLPLSGSDASAQESEPQPEGTTNEDEDVPFDEFVLNPKQPSGKATSVATETTPQSGKKIKAEMPPAAAPVAPQKTEIKEQNDKNTALLTALLNRLSDSELEKGSKRAVKRAVLYATLPSDTDTESETEKKLIPNVLVTGTHERNEVLVSSSFEENTPDGNGTSPVTEDKSDSVEAILTLSGDEASAGQHSSQSGNSSDETSMTSDRDNLNDSEDVTFDELLLNPMQPSGGNTTVTATETYPQSGEKRIDKTPAAAPRAPQKKEMPSDAQKRPTGDVIQFDGTTIRQEGKTRSETKREPSLEEYLRERGKEERELLEELDSHRTFGTRDVSENIRKFYVQLDMLYQYKPTAGMDTLETIYRRAENLLGKEFDRLGGKDMTQAQKDMLAKKYEHLDRIWDGKQKYLEKMNEQDTEETPSEAPKEYVMDEPTTTAVMELPTRTRHYGRKNASWLA